MIQTNLYDLNMERAHLNQLITDFDSGKSLVPREIATTPDTCEAWVRFKIDPKRFLPTIFDGDWAFTQKHLVSGSVRLLKALTGSDGITRLIARQGKYLYAYPWFS